MLKIFTAIKSFLLMMNKSKVIFDGRNLYDLDKMKDLGVHYQSIGREIIKPK